MGNIKFTPDLFLGTAELNRLSKFVDTEGFRKNIIQNTTNFGLIKNSNDPSFANGRVQRDLDNALGQKTIKINELFGIDNAGNFLHSQPLSGIPIPNDGNWYWIKVAYAVSNVEKGIFSISGNGDLIDTSGTGELKKILRGMPNFPTRIRFTNSQYNTLEYDVLEVIDDQHATIQHPASNANGISAFEPETGLIMEIVGTFTKGIAVPEENKLPFNYDSANFTVVLEAFLNVPPTPFTAGSEFYIARVKATGSTVIIQDKRINYWETKGSNINLEIDRTANPSIGIESAQFNNAYSAADKNIVSVAWGIRSNNWSIDSSNNIITFASGNGGKYKTVNDFNNGDFVGGRLYAGNGKYGKIIGSTKQGSAINFQLDVLDINNFSPDGGTTLNSGYLLVVPDCDTVEILFTPNPADNVPVIAQSFKFPVNTLVGKCEVLVYGTTVQYNVQYRYKTIKEFSQYTAIPSDTVNGYLTEASFDGNGNLKTSDQRVYYPHTSDPVNGFIQLNISPNSISRFRQKVDKGDIIGVQNITSFAGVTNFPMIVGTNKNYIYVNGNVTLPNDVYFALDRAAAVEGNEFRIHFDCSAVNLAGHKIFIVQDFGTGTQTTLKTITQGDIYQMFNQDGGITFTMKYDGSNWHAYQNYTLGRPFEIIQTDGVLTDLFDTTSGLGKVKGLFGYVLCDSARTVNGINVPDLKQRFLIGHDETVTAFNKGAVGGSENHTLTAAEQGHIAIQAKIDDISGGTSNALAQLKMNGVELILDGANNQAAYGTSVNVPLSDASQPHSILNPYYAIIFAKKVF